MRTTASFVVALLVFAEPAAAQELSLKQPGWVSSVAFSPDGKLLASACSDMSARLHSGAGGELLRTFAGHTDSIVSVALSDKFLATGSFDHTARLWDVSSGQLLSILKGHRGAVMSVAFSPDGELLATGSIDSSVSLWDCKPLKLRKAVQGHKSWVNSVAFSSDGAHLVSGSSDGTVKIWNVAAGVLKRTLPATDAEVRCVAISPNRKFIAAGMRYGTIRTWIDEKESLLFKAHDGDVWSLAFTSDSKTLISGGGDWNKPGQIKVWDSATGRIVKEFAHSGEVLSVAISADGRRVAAGAGDKTVKIWDYPPANARAGALRVGAATSEFESDDTMIIAGGITAGKAKGQEGKLRAVAVVLEQQPFGKLAIVACDVLMMTRAHLDPAAREIESSTGIPFANILINCTHTHHAPSTMVLHGYGLDETFVKRVQAGIVKAVQQANANLSEDNCRFFFHLAEERTVGQNSRQLLPDGQIYWIGPRTNFARATGPFDPELPVLAFRDSRDRLRAVIFNHSTHTIGTRTPGVRSPSFYGLAAQELEAEAGGVFCFLEGASGSTHNLELSGEEAIRRVRQTLGEGLAQAQARPVTRLAALKRSFKFKVRNFDEAAEDKAVSRYCQQYVGAYGQTVIQVFRDMRKTLASQRGQQRETWLQVMLIGDVALVGVPAEYFTQLGLDIKNRSPFRHTYVAELANDWIGYLPNLEGHKLGGYQVWTGYHSYAEPGTGERIADEITSMLKELAK